MSQKIKILPEDVANQIAAGEVVERPASVVKELVENSIDAHATAIEVQVENAGRRLIRIIDNGDGMPAQDLRLSVLRHATSKLRDVNGLTSIRTFGFRGEALPSVQSVSRFSISSRSHGSEAAVQLTFDDLGRMDEREAGHAQGTIVEVRDLFFNVPARLAFLKTGSTETSRIQQDFSKLALAHPNIAFLLRLDGRISMDFPAVTEITERFGQVLGTGFLAESLELKAISALDPQFRVSGRIGKPVLSRSNRSGQYLFVNRRAVEHRMLGFTLAQAYGSLIPAGKHATAVIFLETGEGDLDVNVHPAKREVRFRDEKNVLDSIRRTVRDALGAANLMAVYSLEKTSTSEHGVSTAFHETISTVAAPLPIGILNVSPAPHQIHSPWMGREDPTRVDPNRPVPLAQLHRSYVICQDGQGLVLVDQHAAHERVLYEKYCKTLKTGTTASQHLLLPQRIEPSSADAVRLRGWVDSLGSMGLEVNDMGNDLFYIAAIPAFLKNVSVAPLILELLATVSADMEKDPLGSLRDEIAAQMACRAAIKAGDPLSLDEMSQLLADLFQCEIPWSCPHGRPPFVRLPLEELEKYFERR